MRARTEPIAMSVAAALALAWIATAAPQLADAPPLLARRTFTLVPPFLLLAAGAAVSRRRRRAQGPLFAALAVAWVSWSVVERWRGGTGDLGEGVLAALHERVWLPAAALAAVALLDLRERSQDGHALAPKTENGNLGIGPDSRCPPGVLSLNCASRPTT